MPVFETDLGPGDVFTVPQLEGYRGPVGVLLGIDGGVHAGDRTVSITLPTDTVESRQRCWERELGDRAGEDVATLGACFMASGELIREYASLAVANAELAGRNRVSLSDVQQAARSVNQQQLDSLATRLNGEGGWSRLIVPEQTLNQLMGLERRCREREPLCRVLGQEFPGGFNRGVRALFEGPSGTGKTLAARALAAELGLDIYRVDLAAIVNKYVGETEKNLSRVLGRAEDLDVVLLLDEGDALLARRTDVRTANDRYANLETNYLLQRLETYQGVVIITTNLGGQIDPAFRRRIDVSIKFPAPQPAERWQLWSLHLPVEHRIPADLLDEVASRYAMTGSQIRNAVVFGSLLALDRSDVLTPVDLLAGIEAEHRKAGASLPLGSLQRGRHQEPELRAFLEYIT
jgi:AAA+ superfamily predicted ATPase